MRRMVRRGSELFDYFAVITNLGSGFAKDVGPDRQTQVANCEICECILRAGSKSKRL